MSEAKIAYTPEAAQFVWAIDVGTDGTCPAIGTFGTGRTHLITNWFDCGSSGFGSGDLKNLSAILYDVSQHEDEQFVPKPVAYGYKAEELYQEYSEEAKNPSLYAYFSHYKMELLRDGKDATLDIPGTKRQIKVSQIFVDYLTMMRVDVEKFIEKEYKNQFDLRQSRVCLTVPAIYPETLKDLMKDVAYQAGIISTPRPDDDQFQIVLEPEAAAVCVMEEAKESGEAFEDDSVLLILDVGGGTNDMTVHLVKNKRLREVVSSSGGPHGSTFVDKAFWNVVKEKFGESTIQQFRERHPTSALDLHRKWIAVKKATNSLARSARVEVPLTFFNFIKECAPSKTSEFKLGKIVLTPQEMEAIFLPSLRNIVSDLKEFYAKTMKQLKNERFGKVYVYLVGGYSESCLLVNAVTEALAHEDCLIKKSKTPGSAVLRGAVTYGFDPSVVKTRRMKITVGTFGHPPTGKDGCEHDEVFCRIVQAEQEVAVGESVLHYFQPHKAHQTSAHINVFSTIHDPDESQLSRQSKGVFSLASFDLNMPDTSGGLDRVIEIKYTFGKTMLEVWAKDLSSGSTERVDLEFHGM